MATMNPFDLLGDDDTDDVSQLLAAKAPVAAAAAAPASKKATVQDAKPQAKLPSKPLPPTQAVREARNESSRGGGRGGGRGDGRGRGGRGSGGGRGFDRDSTDNENAFASNNGYSVSYGSSEGYRNTEDGEAGKTGERRSYGAPRGGFRGPRRGGYSNGEDADGERPPRRTFDRRSGTGRGNEFKRDGSGRGNWGTPTDEIAPESEEPVNEGEKFADAEKQAGQETAGDATKDAPAEEAEEKEKEPEEKEMTLEEYQKVLEEKRKALQAIKPEERKVGLDKELEAMKLLSNKKNDDDIFIKLGSDKDKRKEAVEKAKKAVSINEFLKPAEGENYYRTGGRGRGGRGRGRGGYGNNSYSGDAAPSIEDVGQFPSLGGK